MEVARYGLTLARSCVLSSWLPLALSLPAQPVAGDHVCEKDPAYHKLDFWLGHWDVVDPNNGTLGGTSFIEKILDGNALIENWYEFDPRGSDGKSLFYCQKATHQWKQVWVGAAGPIKEKRLIEEFKDGGVGFQGEIARPDGPRIWTGRPRHRSREIVYGR